MRGGEPVEVRTRGSEGLPEVRRQAKHHTSVIRGQGYVHRIPRRLPDPVSKGRWHHDEEAPTASGDQRGAERRSVDRPRDAHSRARAKASCERHRDQREGPGAHTRGTNEPRAESRAIHNPVTSGVAIPITPARCTTTLAVPSRGGLESYRNGFLRREFIFDSSFRDPWKRIFARSRPR